MRWLCKNCSFSATKRVNLLRHYRLKHFHTGQGHTLPCLYSNCPCLFKTWGALHAHLSRYHHSDVEREGQSVTFLCLVCNLGRFHTERPYFEHLGSHLKKFEAVACVFKDCDFRTNLYSTFASHKSRKHTPHCLGDFKQTVLLQSDQNPSTSGDCVLGNESEVVSFDDTVVEKGEDSVKSIVDELGSLLLKLECIFNVPTRCIDEIVEELQFVASSASAPIIKNIVQNTLENYSCSLAEPVVTDLVKNICKLNPFSIAFNEQGPLGTAYRRGKYLKERFCVVEPIEYILDIKPRRTFQYVPILQSLSHILSNTVIQEKVFTSARQCNSSSCYTSFHDGSHFKGNAFWSGEDLRLSLLLYCDDFEICNPLGTSRKKHKVTAVYWVLGDIPSEFRSTLSSIYLAVLCKADDVKTFGYNQVLEPLLADLRSLEDIGFLVPCLGKTIKGSVFSVIADNLGAHSLGGFLENFCASHVCRFCIAERSQFQELEVRSGAFSVRTKQQHALDVEASLVSNHHSRGVKRKCPVTEKLQHFHVTTGYPPDVLHDLLEGIVPVELALCLDNLIKKKYFSFDELNQIIRQFPYKWKDRTNCPQGIPPTFVSRKTIGGNATENWCLLRLLPFMIGSKVSEGDPAWQLLMTLKDVVELVMSPTHTDASIGYLDSLISEHRQRFRSVFPQEKLLPKHHFIEHYPQLIKDFGPLISLWSMRFEAKHSFFKKIVRHTSCFRNIVKSMAKKHQSMIAYNLHCSQVHKPSVSVSKSTRVPLEVVSQELREFVTESFPGESSLHLARQADFRGTPYSAGMMVVCGSSSGCPDFSEILQVVIIQDSLVFVAKLQNAWYCEHLRCYMLEPTRTIKVVKLSQLPDPYPLAAYALGGGRMVSMKHHVCLSD